ncbi:MAG: NAD(P)/FAD-dependent oxidoreductase, partial [Bacteroidetes bacterium]
MSTTTPVLLIGAGPAGLAMAGRLHHHQIPYLLLEASETLVPSWRNHYDRVHLHTVKEHSHLPYAPFPADYPRYIPRDQLIAYYEAYARERNIQPRLGQRVIHLTRTDTLWQATTTTGEVYVAPEVVLCTGVNREPHQPAWPGMEQFQGQILHSRAYRSGAPFAGQRVLIVGMGNTGAELAIDLHEHGAQAALSVRGPVNIVLRDFLGRPTQKTSMLLRRLPNWL